MGKSGWLGAGQLRPRFPLPRGTAEGPAGAHAQPRLQTSVLLRHPEAAPVLQRHEGQVREARAELPEEAALKVRQHAVHVHQHPQGAAARTAPLIPDRSAAGTRAATAQPEHLPVCSSPWVRGRRSLRRGHGRAGSGPERGPRAAPPPLKRYAPGEGERERGLLLPVGHPAPGCSVWESLIGAIIQQ